LVGVAWFFGLLFFLFAYFSFDFFTGLFADFFLW